MENLGGSEELLNEIMDVFVENTAENIEKLEKMFQENDLDSAAQVAHSIKGSSGNITSDAMFQVAIKLEEYCKEGHLEKAREEFENLKELFRWFQERKGAF